MEAKESFSDAFLLQGLQISASKAMKSTIGVGLVKHETIETPGITLETLVELTVNRLHLTICTIFLKKRGFEELGKSVKSFVKAIVRAVKVVVSVSE